MTARMPGIVTEVSATFVARMMRRLDEVLKARCCSPAGSEARSGVEGQRPQGGGDGVRQVALLLVDVAMADRNRKEASRDDERGGVVEEGGEALRIERRGGDDQLQVAPAR